MHYKIECNGDVRGCKVIVIVIENSVTRDFKLTGDLVTVRPLKFNL